VIKFNISINKVQMELLNLLFITELS